MLREEMERAGLARAPYHLLVPHKRLRYARCDVIFHIREQPLPPRTLLRAYNGPLITGPELIFCDLASSAGMDAIDLVQVGYELCGRYLIRDCWDGYIENSTCATSTEKIERVISGLAYRRGISAARKLVKCVNNGSNSPMETVLAMLLNLPKPLGGQGLKPISLNYPVTTLQGVKFVDIAFPWAKVGLEYKGREAHSVEKASRDDRRQNTLTGSGWTILSVWYEDLTQSNLYEKLLQEVFCLLHLRRRCRSEAYRAQERILRMKLLPAIEKYQR